AEVKRRRELFAKVCAGERGLDELGRFGAGHDDESDDGGPAAEFAVAEESDGLANVVNFNAQSKGGRIQKAEQAVGKRRILAEEFFNGGVIELGCAGCLKKAETNGLAGGNFAAGKHGRLAEEIALVIGVAEGLG